MGLHGADISFELGVAGGDSVVWAAECSTIPIRR